MQQRSEQRLKTVLKAEIRYNDGMMSTPCIVRDLSEHGARLELPGEVALPDRFDLYIQKRHKTYRACVRRRNGREIGVAFEDASPDSLPERVAKLERDVADIRVLLAKIAAALKISN